MSDQKRARPLAVVGGIILDQNGQILLAERPQGKILAGFWEFPGGKIEDGESPEQAIARELKEELELKIKIIERLGVFKFEYGWGWMDLHIFVVQALNPPKTTADVQNFRWTTVDQIDAKTLAPADVAPLNEFLRRRSSGPKPR